MRVGRTIEISNLRRGGPVAALLRWGCWLSLLAGQALALAAVAAYVLFSRDLPPLDVLVHYRPPQTTRLYTSEGLLLAEYATTRRTLLPPEQIPLRVRRAFLAAEDGDFYRHGGIDVAGVLRAVLRLAENRGGRPQQGGSTITQQLAKALIGHEKTFVRKAREAVLARRLEAVLSKDQILWTYLNHVYLGRGAYGVAEAAQAYFGRPLAELSLGEVAYLAGLPQRPSALSRDPLAARARQGYVLEQLVARGWASAEEQAAARSREVQLAPERDLTLWRAPYAAEAVRQQLVERFGEAALYEGGLRVETTISLADQHEAQAALVAGLEAVDRRQGWHGPLGHLQPGGAARLRQAWAAPAGDFQPGRDGLRPALVEEVSRDALRLTVGRETATISRSDSAWARRYDEQAEDNKATLEDFRSVVRPGDVVVVRQRRVGAAGAAGDERAADRTPPTAGAPDRAGERGEAASTDGADQPPTPDARWELVPFGPAGVQGAVLLREAGTGYLRALVGGKEADLSVFDRAHQACRQPGSVFKPLYYAAALARGFTAATMLTDAPFKVELEGSFFAYRARNADRRFRGDMLLAEALAQSRNIPSLKVFLYVGAAAVVDFARGLGVRSPLAPVDALALGASCVRPAEMVGAYALFRDGGHLQPELLVRRVRDAAGQPLLDRRHPSDDSLDPAEALAATRAYRSPPLAAGLTPEVAYVTAALLRGVVERGTAAQARTLSVPVAGKTGTTDHYDAWFVGFSAHRVVGVWIGPDDNRRVLGRGEHGGKVALPVFSRLIERTHGGLPRVELPGEPPPGVEWVDVDPLSGDRAAAGRGLRLPFVVGTAPAAGPDDGQDAPTASGLDADRLGGQF